MKLKLRWRERRSSPLSTCAGLRGRGKTRDNGRRELFLRRGKERREETREERARGGKSQRSSQEVARSDNISSLFLPRPAGAASGFRGETVSSLLLFLCMFKKGLQRRIRRSCSLSSSPRDNQTWRWKINETNTERRGLKRRPGAMRDKNTSKVTIISLLW